MKACRILTARVITIKSLSEAHSSLMQFCKKFESMYGQLEVTPRVRTGHGKPGKSWNLSISVSRPGKSWNLIVGYGKAWKIIVCGVRKLLQVSKQGQNKIQADYARKYLKTRMIFESGS